MNGSNKANAKWALIQKTNKQILVKNRTARTRRRLEEMRMTAEIEFSIARMKSSPFRWSPSET